MDELSFASIRTALETSISPIMPMTMAKPAGLAALCISAEEAPPMGETETTGTAWKDARADRRYGAGPQPYPGAGCWNG